MDLLLLDILSELKAGNPVDEALLTQIIRKHNKNRDNADHFSKRRLLPFYLKTKQSDFERWASWDIDEETEYMLLQVLRMKPRRTASGVATITVITKPWPCSSDCLYCPNDLRMPKSYLSDEPACQRAERNYFDPYLQVSSRLRALNQMGHATDKIELIILGGSFSDYPTEYQVWFVSELFRALNDDDRESKADVRRAFYKEIGLSNSEEELSTFVRQEQKAVNEGSRTYNQAIRQIYQDSKAWQRISQEQTATLDELRKQQIQNETAKHRIVGLVIETRPDTITTESLTLIRELGATKVQIGIQSLDPVVLGLNNRHADIGQTQDAFKLLRIFGFKIHAHVMRNLYGSTSEQDKQDYVTFVTDREYLPDEVKLYPCALVEGTGLMKHFEEKTWRPYTESELIDVLVTDTLNTPPYIRISRMIRDISAHDIIAGNKKANLRQLVERRIEESCEVIHEIRYREINRDETDLDDLTLETIVYETSNTDEYFLQWVTPENRIAGFLRLSLPKTEYVCRHQSELPIKSGEAMIREVHIYGKVAQLSKAGENAQHLGLGKELIKTACDIARDQGYDSINVISSVGTREYYRNLGFGDSGLYQQMPLT